MTNLFSIGSTISSDFKNIYRQRFFQLGSCDNEAAQNKPKWNSPFSNLLLMESTQVLCLNRFLNISRKKIKNINK